MIDCRSSEANVETQSHVGSCAAQMTSALRRASTVSADSLVVLLGGGPNPTDGGSGPGDRGARAGGVGVAGGEVSSAAGAAGAADPLPVSGAESGASVGDGDAGVLGCASARRDRHTRTKTLRTDLAMVHERQGARPCVTRGFLPRSLTPVTC
jgi:hypothetical protein